MSTDLPCHPKSRPIPEKRLRQPGPRGSGRGDAPSVMPVNRLYLQARSSVSDVFLLHPIAWRHNRIPVIGGSRAC